MNDRKDSLTVIHNLRKAQRTDPLTRVSARYPFEHATPADYAQSVELHEPMDSSWHRNDWLYQIAVIVCAISTLGVLGILAIELLGLTK